MDSPRPLHCLFTDFFVQITHKIIQLPAISWFIKSCAVRNKCSKSKIRVLFFASGQYHFLYRRKAMRVLISVRFPFFITRQRNDNYFLFFTKRKVHESWKFRSLEFRLFWPNRGWSQINIMCAIGITFQIHLLISDQLQHLLSLRHSDDEGNMMWS